MSAPGAPGIQPAWTSSAKDGVSTTLGGSRIWLTIGRGILNEVYWPRVDSPQIRDLGFIVADGAGYWSEVKRDSEYELVTPQPGVPAYSAIHHTDRYTLRLDFCPDPDRDVVLIRARLDAPPEYKLYPLLAPHLGNTGFNNTAWVGEAAGRLALMATVPGASLALVAAGAEKRDALLRGGAGYVGTSDGWQDFNDNGQMDWTYGRAENGNVALIGEIAEHDVVLALGFGDRPELAGTLAVASVQFPFGDIMHNLSSTWSDWQGTCRLPDVTSEELLREARISAAVLKIHEDQTVPGAVVASLSVPWGQSRDDAGGYHLVWARDLVETSGGLLAFGAVDDARRVLSYLMSTQRSDGHWTQNQWLDGRAFWSGIQLDETGLPIILAQGLKDRNALDGLEVTSMIERAASYLAVNGPVTGQDRWEEDPGLSPFTLAIEVAALVCAANFLNGPARAYALELADTWNNRIEDWTFARGTDLAQHHGISGYYVRIAPAEVVETANPSRGFVTIKNRLFADTSQQAESVIGLEFLYLVRTGLRRADDEGIRDSVKLADALLKVETPNGPVWHRYNLDGYGEHEDGSPFDGTGVGRGWPLLVGERGHYALVAGEPVEPYLQTMCRMSSKGGMIPEQVWDTDDLPRQHLLLGQPSGSAMPLVWAHAEYLKLMASMMEGKPVDRPMAVWERYHGVRPDVPWIAWRFNQQVRSIPAGKLLRLEVTAAARAHWGDGGPDWHDAETRDTELGIHLVDLATTELTAGTTISFTFFWTGRGAWEGRNFEVQVVDRQNDQEV
ncbi:MAG TPA: glycoside hydrolase family 15 protein [Nitrolancea sp.]|nr:glycoside hydrolase family 15 protein [Nitrolancea sp.]